MQDFWLLNGFFVALGLIHISIALIFIVSAKRLNPNFSRQTVAYNLLVSGLLISLTATVILILGRSLSLLVVAVINLAITFISLRLNLFHARERDPILTHTNTPQDTTTEIELEANRQSHAITDRQLSTPKLRVEIAPELFAELKEISGDVSVAMDEAIRWWLRRRLIDTDSDCDDLVDRKNMSSTEFWRSPQKSQQDKWND